MRPINQNVRSWRKAIPIGIYKGIHALQFPGSTRMKRMFRLLPLDTERWISALAGQLTASGTVFVDVGAQHGRHFSHVLENGKENTSAVACEANHALAEQLRVNFQYEISKGRLTVFNVAVSDCKGQCDFHVNELDSGYSGFKRRDLAEIGNHFVRTVVETTTIDSIREKLGSPISVIKIDTEGAEFGVLQGADSCIANDRPVVIFECANNAASYYGHDLTGLHRWFTERGYVVHTINGIELDEKNCEHIFRDAPCYDFVACESTRKIEIHDQIAHAIDQSDFAK